MSNVILIGKSTQFYTGASGSGILREESIGGLAAFGNAGKRTKDSVLGTPSAPIHMIATEGGSFKQQLWRTVRTLGLAFLIISGVGALIEDRGITKGVTPNKLAPY